MQLPTSKIARPSIVLLFVSVIVGQTNCKDSHQLTSTNVQA